VRLTGDRAKLTLLPKALSELEDRWLLRPSLSPDDTTLAFQSDESGRSEIYAVAFPGFTDRVLVSRAGGRDPCWSRNGSALFYLSLDGLAMMAAPVSNQNGRQFSEAVKLFDLPASICVNMRAGRTMSLFDVSADAQRFLMMQNVKDADAADSEPTVLLIQNWFEEFQKK
jgi:hypothetical protein